MNELHIRLFEQAGQYLAELLAPPPGAATCNAPVPAGWPCRLVPPSPLPSGHTLEDFQAALLSLQPGEAENELSQIGRYLFRFLFGPDGQENALYRHWLDCFKQGQQETGLRTVLHPESDRLAGLPWELISNEQGLFLAAMQRPKPNTLLRTCWKAGDLSASPVALPDPLTQEPLRVLLVICHASEDDKRIMGPEEALRVDAALYKLLPWKVDLNVLVRPSLKTTLEWCAQWQPHIFHYVGHGDYDGQVSYLKFYEPGQTDSIAIDPAALSNFFGNNVPRLVVLNACRSGQVGNGAGSDENTVRGNQNLCKVLIEGGVLAVIAMQADIEGESAASLMDVFYRRLAAGETVDQALTSARLAYLRQSGLGSRKWDWALPALYLSTRTRSEDVLLLNAEGAESRIFQVDENEPDRYKRLVQDLQLKTRIQVGREKEMFQLERSLLSAELDKIPPVTLLYGEPSIGKTNLLYWLSEGLARRSRCFIYADFGQAALNYWDSLRLIRDGRLEAKVSGVRLRNELNPSVAFNNFNHALNSKLVKGYAAAHPVAPEAGTPVEDLAMDRNPATELENLGTVLSNENPLETITEAFWSSLARIAEPDGLLIFLDHVDRMFSGEVNKLRNYLVNRVLNPENYPNARKVRLVLAIQSPAPDSASQERPWDFLLDQPKVEIQRLAGLQPQDLIWLARQWARRYFISYGPAYLKDKNLTPENIDAYVTGLLNQFYLKRPQRPGRLVEDLLNRDNIEDWLSSLNQG